MGSRVTSETGNHFSSLPLWCDLQEKQLMSDAKDEAGEDVYRAEIHGQM